MTTIKQAAKLYKINRQSDATKSIYAKVDELMWEHLWETIDEYIEEALQPENYSINLAIALLTSTLPVRTRLKQRVALYERAAKDPYVLESKYDILKGLA